MGHEAVTCLTDNDNPDKAGLGGRWDDDWAGLVETGGKEFDPNQSIKSFLSVIGRRRIPFCAGK